MPEPTSHPPSSLAAAAAALPPPPSASPPLTAGRAATLALGAGLACFAVLAAPFLVTPWLPRARFGGLPYHASSAARVRAALDALPPRYTRAGARFVDLGSGDGVAVLEAARRGLRAEGVELNPTLYALSAARGLAQGHGARFSLGNMFAHDVARADVVLVFGVRPIMARLARKLAREAPTHAIVLSRRFELPPLPQAGSEGAGWAQERAEAQEQDQVRGEAAPGGPGRHGPGPGPGPGPASAPEPFREVASVEGFRVYARGAGAAEIGAEVAARASRAKAAEGAQGRGVP